MDGTSRLVSWAGTGTASVEWSPNGGGTWQTVASNVAGDETNITVPNRPTTNGRIRVNRTFTPTASAVVFPITVTSAPQPPGSPECIDLTLGSCQTCYWAIKTRDAHGVWSAVSNSPGASTRCSGSLQMLCAQAVEELSANAGTLPSVLSIGAISPNPATSPVVIPLAIPADLSGVDVEMKIFDVTGRLVQSIDAGKAEPGTRHIDWDLRESSGRNAANGVYFVRVRVGDTVEKRRVLLAR